MSMKNLGDYLRKEREKKGLTIDEIAAILKMTPNNIQNLEMGNLEAIRLNDIFIKSHLKSYIKELDKNPDEVFKKFSLYEETKNSKIGTIYHSTPLFNPVLQFLGVIIFGFLIYFYINTINGDHIEDPTLKMFETQQNAEIYNNSSIPNSAPITKDDTY